MSKMTLSTAAGGPLSHSHQHPGTWRGASGSLRPSGRQGEKQVLASLPVSPTLVLLSIIFALQYPIYGKPCWFTNCNICNIGLPCQMFAEITKISPVERKWLTSATPCLR